MSVNKFLPRDAIHRRVININAILHGKSREIRIGAVLAKLDTRRSVIEVGRNKSTILVRAGDCKFVVNQGRGEIVPRARRKTENLLIRTANVVPIIHAARIVESSYSRV